MDNPRGTFRAGLPGTAPRTAGSALHHEQTVGKTVSSQSLRYAVINGVLHIPLLSGLSVLNKLTFSACFNLFIIYA